MSLDNSPESAPFQNPPKPPFETTPDDRQWAMFCHLSALLGLLVAGLTFIGPLVCWLIKKDQSPFVDYHGKEALNFQINILFYTLIAAAITFVTCGAAFPILFVPLVLGIVMPIIAGLKANEGSYYEYPATWRLIK